MAAITKEFLEAEIVSLEVEMNKARVFMIQAEATIAAYQMLIGKLNAPVQAEEEKQE